MNHESEPGRRQEGHMRRRRLTTISLRPEEAVLGHCKTAGSGGPVQAVCTCSCSAVEHRIVSTSELESRWIMSSDSRAVACRSVRIGIRASQRFPAWVVCRFGCQWRRGGRCCLAAFLEPFRSRDRCCLTLSIRVSGLTSLAPQSERSLFDSGSTWRLYEDEAGFQFDFTRHALGKQPYQEALVDAHFRRATLQMNEERFATHCPVRQIPWSIRSTNS